MVRPRAMPRRELTISLREVMPLRRRVVRIWPRWRIVAKMMSDDSIVAMVVKEGFG